MTKSKRGRLKDRTAIRDARKPYCEMCGDRAWGGPHHIIFKSENGPDHRFNLIQLCKDCHQVKVHKHNVYAKATLFHIVARREQLVLSTMVEIVLQMTNGKKVKIK